MTIFHQFKLLKRSGGEFSYGTYICQRWFRMSVAMFGTLLALYLYPLIGDGPMWRYNEDSVLRPCRSVSSLISSFLYYSNWNYPLDSYNYATKPYLPIVSISGKPGIPGFF